MKWNIYFNIFLFPIENNSAKVLSHSLFPALKGTGLFFLLFFFFVACRPFSMSLLKRSLLRWLAE